MVLDDADRCDRAGTRLLDRLIGRTAAHSVPWVLSRDVRAQGTAPDGT